ncbi:MAG: hypothetical protein AB202_00395 [Parcubacteria bacterium C7867-007]|nr:MAG: hypothetical protein AB202_00395 [Parcubacteria bacterium C7867-007]
MNTRFVKLFLVTLPILVVIDFLWAGIIAIDFYRSQAGDLITMTPNIPPLVLFYLIYTTAITYFVLRPALAARSFKLLLINGALLGLTAYGTYDLVTLGLTPGWTTLLTIVDIIWGIVLTTGVSAIVYSIATRFKI